MATFAVSAVDRPTRPKPALDRDASVRSLLGARVEALSPGGRRLVSCTDSNAFAQAAHDAFYEHLPLVLTPDAVWFCIAQGFARHVNLNVEVLRKRFVAHEGKEKLVVERPDMALGTPGPWHEVVAEFSQQLGARLGKKRDLIVADFSTTGAVERVASEILLMDAFQGYFEYEMMAGCGIPEITLLGTPDDWRSIRRRTSALGEYGLEKWTDTLVPVLDRVIATAEGDVDAAFWRSFFRYQSGSGPSELTGWILTLFPYIDDLTWKRGGTTRTPIWNPYLEGWQRRFTAADNRKPSDFFGKTDGPGILQIPSSLASAPVRYVDVRDGAVTPLRFVAGLTGVAQDERTLALAPDFAWAVVYDRA